MLIRLAKFPGKPLPDLLVRLELASPATCCICRMVRPERSLAWEITGDAQPDNNIVCLQCAWVYSLQEVDISHIVAGYKIPGGKIHILSF